MKDTSHIIIRKEYVVCTVCMDIIPVNAGDGTPMPSLLQAFKLIELQHPRTHHKQVYGK